MPADDLQQIERTNGVIGHFGPEAIIATTPDQPHVAPGDLLLRERQGSVHVVEVILRFLRERSAIPPVLLGFVENLTGLRWLGAACQDQAPKQTQCDLTPTIPDHCNPLEWRIW